MITSLLASLAMVVVAGLRPPTDTAVVEASRLVLKGRDGRVIAEMSADEGGLPRLRMFDTTGRGRLEFGISDQGVQLFFRDKAGNGTISLTTVDGVSSTLSVHQPDGRTIQFSVAGDEPGEASFQIGRDTGPNDFDLLVFPKINSLSLGSHGRETKRGSTLRLGTEASGGAFLDLSDAKDLVRFSVESDPKGEVTLKTRDAEKKLLFKVP